MMYVIAFRSITLGNILQLFQEESISCRFLHHARVCSMFLKTRKLLIRWVRISNRGNTIVWYHIPSSLSSLEIINTARGLIIAVLNWHIVLLGHYAIMEIKGEKLMPTMWRCWKLASSFYVTNLLCMEYNIIF